jgi:hypothetical protein
MTTDSTTKNRARILRNATHLMDICLKSGQYDKAEYVSSRLTGILRAWAASKVNGAVKIKKLKSK